MPGGCAAALAIYETGQRAALPRIPGTRPGMTVGLAERKRLSARHPRRAGGHVVEGERHRYAGVMPHQRDDVGDADVPERLDRAVVEALRYPACIREADR